MKYELLLYRYYWRAQKTYICTVLQSETDFCYFITDGFAPYVYATGQYYYYTFSDNSFTLYGTFARDYELTGNVRILFFPNFTQSIFDWIDSTFPMGDNFGIEHQKHRKYRTNIKIRRDECTN